MAKITLKITKSEKKRYIKKRLSTDPECATRALMLLYEQGQTDTEKVHEGRVLEEVNGRGFTLYDSEFLTSLAEQYLHRGYLSHRQDAILMKKMPRYWRQILDMADAHNLTEAILRDRAVFEQSEATNVC